MEKNTKLIERLKEELDELNTKLTALDNALRDKIPDISNYHYSLLKMQYAAMVQYKAIIEIRLEDLK